MWFDVDKDGLAKVVERHGIAFLLRELIANGFDAPGVTSVKVTMVPVPLAPFVKITVEDDSPEGFTQLSHAWTLYAESNRKGDSEKRGRFNIGEKLVLSRCRYAEIATTTGTVIFDDSPPYRHHYPSRCRDRGSVFVGEVRMTRDEIEPCIDELCKILPPLDVILEINGLVLQARAPITVCEDTLATEVAGEDGIIRRSARKAKVEILEVRKGETATLYELGIPVVETGDKFHVNVLQKVPLSADRNSVPDSFRRHVRTLVLNATANTLSKEEAASKWAQEALEDDRVSVEAVTALMDAQWGKDRFSQDPTDPEGEKIGISRGYTKVGGGAYSGKAWENIRRAGAILPAGKVCPSPKPFSPGGAPLKITPKEKWTPEMKARCAWVRELAKILLGHDIAIMLTPDRKWGFSGCYGTSHVLHVNYGLLGKRWFTTDKLHDSVLGFLCHEFTHDKVRDHLSSEFHEQQARLMCIAARHIRSNPEFWR